MKYCRFFIPVLVLIFCLSIFSYAAEAAPEVSDGDLPGMGGGFGTYVLPTVITVVVACFVYWFINRKK